LSFSIVADEFLLKSAPPVDDIIQAIAAATFTAGDARFEKLCQNPNK